jgi:hypothetical protein
MVNRVSLAVAIMLVALFLLVGCSRSPVQHTGKCIVRSVQYGKYGDAMIVVEWQGGSVQTFWTCDSRVPVFTEERVEDIALQWDVPSCWHVVQVQRGR